MVEGAKLQPWSIIVGSNPTHTSKKSVALTPIFLYIFLMSKERFTFMTRSVQFLKSFLGIRTPAEKDFAAGYDLADFRFSYHQSVDHLQASHDTLLGMKVTDPRLLAELKESMRVTSVDAYFAGYQKRIIEEKAKNQA